MVSIMTSFLLVNDAGLDMAWHGDGYLDRRNLFCVFFRRLRGRSSLLRPLPILDVCLQRVSIFCVMLLLSSVVLALLVTPSSGCGGLYYRSDEQK